MSHQVFADLLQLEQHIRQAECLTVLSFSIVNQTRTLVPYQQAVLLLGSPRPIATSASDHPVLDRTSPLMVWIEKQAGLQHASTSITPLRLSDIPADLSPREILWVPLALPAPPHRPIGGLWLARNEPWTERDIAILQHLAGTYAHAIHAFERHSSLRFFTHWLRHNHFPRYALLASLLLAFVPVRLSVLAPAHITAKAPFIVASPLQGVVKEVLVTSGDAIAIDQALVHLDPQDSHNRYQIAEQEHLRAIAEWRTAQQSGFSDPKQKSRLSELSAQVDIKLAEKTFAYQQWQKTTITSPQAGIAIIDDPMAWQGKPVTTGERILQIANPEQIELNIMLPVSDAIAIQTGADIQFFPDTDPLSLYTASLHRAAYEPEKTPEDIIAYKLIARLDSDQPLLRIGTQGTAKVYGESVSLFYYLFRRPITATRQWLGW
jgi:hypothetical protein